MKKFHYTALAAAFGLLMAGHAAADAPTAELLVKGRIEVPGCTIAIAGEGGDSTSEYNFGEIDPSNIKPGTATTTLAPQTKTWTITCDGKTNLTYQVEDNQQETSSSSATTAFGLGSVNGTGKIGYYEVDMLNAQVSSEGAAPVAARTFSIAKGGTSFTPAASVKLNRNNNMGWSDNAANALAVADTFIADFRVTPTLGGTATMGGTITEDVPLDGSLTFNFAFGL